MTATGLYIYLIAGLSLWLVTEEQVVPDKTSSADVCQSIKGHKSCLPHCEQRQVGCQQQDTCKSVIQNSCLKEGCELCENARKDSNETKCTKKLTPDCIKDFLVEVTTGSFTVDEGASLNLTCSYNLSSQTNESVKFAWFRNGELLKNALGQFLFLPKLFRKDEAAFFCGVLSDCGFFFSERKLVVVKDSGALIIIVCGVAAVVILLLLALGMKVMVKREMEQNRSRREPDTHTEENIYDPVTLDSITSAS
ncbi:uncharacterized protein LOC118224021 isoform X2 [Anguilla anguilla]|uniref:uncharacterized protein LOC118224021 isoform X2 n=1 Tax=Anguilla anguilla TaxID=7936 RepID=UPI0015B2D6FD|nr:uncharacterized protein LOC118224021 isoform X2 [Anguilla anguilla]